MPTNPESEGSRLITLKQIELEHGVSRSALHTYRRSASFPQPVGVAGSTKIQYRADEVAAWFQANPPQQGKRTDLPAKQQKEPAVAKQETTARPVVKDVPTADLVVWLGQQLDEDERTAQACPGDGSWSAADIAVYGPDLSAEVRAHMAAHNPARVLREINAKRQIIQRYESALENRKAHPGDLASAGAVLALHGVVKPLAVAYADRPGFREEWRP